ncbi:hypothetical protein L6164_016041 [Bauhinia variegata]|uniref:Uncharacterized protein n=1 Tax=Bauhinia variegata TaxID=167791 RepID=A0ACB9NSX8_BAUVA|nr:hypothetical protein L6164_016041 [Bauhinia variegata]
MALEAVVFPQDPFSNYSCKDLYSFLAAAGGGAWNTHDYGSLRVEEDKALVGIINNNVVVEQNLHAIWDSASSSPSPSLPLQNVKDQLDSQSCNSPAEATTATATTTAPGRRKRRRTKSAKNEEEIENQRMTHIAVERNRRKQMNEYLAVLRSLMPPSYVQRGDQASIIGGAINFVKELEQLLQSIEAQKKTKQQEEPLNPSPFAEFFAFPQYTRWCNTCSSTNDMARNQRPVADIEVTMVDSHANLKILSKKQSGQLTKMVVGLQSLRLSILHLNVTTVDETVLYTVSVKIEEGCQLNTVDEIAAAANELLRKIQEEEEAASAESEN